MGGKLYNWYKKAKADGKITKDEVKEGVGIITEGFKELKGLEKEADEYVEIVETEQECEKEVR